ncbi:MAG TPA: zinc ABC transporter substrate-binding protein [Methanotrichaceae archaeon]|mgnify:CR=1 FL=1|nr:zinc ABC transporter substrate-binding protein [Methanotrichaceae archaeon]HQI90458.1 zinc ABC transporter substrate-binding protein [Methanotrichaceae archaeon]HQJ28153.1 zinc ABC transporter substrate-binding protein [Methanotrichaceae archaeon]
MKVKSCVILVLLAAALAGGCLSGPQEQPGAKEGNVHAVASIAPLAEFTRAVGGERVNVSVLVPPGVEPHTFEPAPSQIRQVSEADIFIENGAGLEFWMDHMIQVNPKMKVVDTSRGAKLISEEGSDEPDPHLWLSPRSARIQVENICQGLSEIDPEGAEVYLANRDSYIRELDRLDAQLNETLKGQRKRSFLVHHPAWTYLARDYGLEQIPLMENEREPGPRYLAGVIEQAKAIGIDTIFVEPEYNPKAAEVIARELNASVVTIDPLASDYLNNLRIVGSRIGESLR